MNVESCCCLIVFFYWNTYHFDIFIRLTRKYWLHRIDDNHIIRGICRVVLGIVHKISYAIEWEWMSSNSFDGKFHWSDVFSLVKWYRKVGNMIGEKKHEHQYYCVVVKRQLRKFMCSRSVIIFAGVFNEWQFFFLFSAGNRKKWEHDFNLFSVEIHLVRRWFFFVILCKYLRIHIPCQQISIYAFIVVKRKKQTFCNMPWEYDFSDVFIQCSF